MPPPGIHSNELKAGPRRYICTPVFMAALFAIAKRRKLPKFPLMDEWINKMWSVPTYNGLLLASLKK